jgi:hypothetical protein
MDIGYNLSTLLCCIGASKMTYIESKIPVIFLQEGDKIIAYSPALDLSTYGKDENQARQRFKEMAAIFLRECSEMGTIDEVLEECGWHRVSAKSRCACFHH